jgi:hypothetical protein
MIQFLTFSFQVACMLGASLLTFRKLCSYPSFLSFHDRRQISSDLLKIFHIARCVASKEKLAFDIIPRWIRYGFDPYFTFTLQGIQLWKEMYCFDGSFVLKLQDQFFELHIRSPTLLKLRLVE